jgi:NAD(P)-dependent dehydrogenase (short-subunit alcohol dehydrogenase family)
VLPAPDVVTDAPAYGWRMKTALVTGGSKGLGRVVATFLARSGYEVVVTARHVETLNEVVREVSKDGGRIRAIAGGVDDASHRRVLAEAFGDGLDVLVNNASELGPMLPLAEHDLDAMRCVLETNVVAPIALTQGLLPGLRARKGLVVNITSDAALGAYETWGSYGASKAALELATRTLANELRPDGIGVVVVDPGDMRTDMHQAAFAGEDISDRPLPDVTVPFWAWLFSCDHLAVTGARYQAQGEQWELDGAQRLPARSS